MSGKTMDDTGTFEEKGSLGHIEDVIGMHGGQLEREVNDNRPRLRGKTLTYALAFVAGTGFTLFG